MYPIRDWCLWCHAYLTHIVDRPPGMGTLMRCETCRRVTRFD
jgi:hypothetical protein